MKNLVLALILVASFAANAELSFEQKANLLSERIDFLSQFSAQKYIPLLDQKFSSCFGSIARTRANAGYCLDQAVAAVRDEAMVADYDSYLRTRLIGLSRGGYLSHFAMPAPGPTLGILGDSLATGAVADLNLEANLLSLIYDGLIDFMFLDNTAKPQAGKLLRSNEFAALKNARWLKPLVRVFDTPEDHKTGLSRTLENGGSAYVDCNECSFPYLLARNSGFPAQNIFLSAQDGVRVGSIHKQMQRLALPLGHLPDYIVISFTGNDICSDENATVSGEQKSAEYSQEMFSELTASLKDFKPAPNGTHILVVAAADVVNLVTNSSVLNKVVPYYVPFQDTPKTVTCRDIRKQRVPWAEKINSMCNFILKTDPDNAPRVAKIKELHDAVVKGQREAVEQTEQWIQTNQLSAKFSIVFSDEILATQFEAGDIANECFHPSIRGHEKIALKMKPDFDKLLGRYRP